MSNENYLREVREHYENYPYPLVNPEDEFTRLYMPICESFDRLNFYCFEGKRNFNKDFRALVAGGGTGDAVIALAEQLRDCGQEVTYIDMSEASMKIAQARAKNRGLTNIRWVRDSLLNIPTLGLGEFDYINCSGVLHHLADPDLGLHTLASVLKEDGAMAIMVYATYGRSAVYPMQELLRIINRDEPNLQQRVDNAKAILGHLPSTSWFPHSPPEIIGEVQSDIGIFDLLLHSQDRAYTIPQLYDFLEKQQLNLIHLFPEHLAFGARQYDPIFYVPPSLEPLVRALPLRDQQALAELLHGKIFKHTFYAAKTTRTPPALGDLDYIPYFGTDVSNAQHNIADAIKNAEDIVYLEENTTQSRTSFAKAPHHEAIIRAIDGVRSLREVFRVVIDSYNGRKGAPNYPQLMDEFAPMYKALNTYYWMFVRAPHSSRIQTYNELQDRVQKS